MRGQTFVRMNSRLTRRGHSCSNSPQIPKSISLPRQEEIRPTRHEGTGAGDQRPFNSIGVAADDLAAGTGRQLLVNAHLCARGHRKDIVVLGHADGVAGGRVELP